MASAEQKHATGSNGTAKNSSNKINSVLSEQEQQPKDAKDLLPHLESLERIIKLPVVNAAWDKSQDVYGKVKGKNRVFEWALTAAEDCVTRAVTTAAPYVTKLDRPISFVDQTLVKGIDKLEVKAPIIKDTPQEIYNQAKSKVIDVVQPHLERVVKFKAAGQQKAASLKDLAWQKANEVLATQYGSLAVNGVDTTTALAERLLEYYFPKSESDVEEDNVPVSASEDPVLHTVQTVGRLSNKISRRVYRNVSRQIKQVQKGNINDYLSSLIAALKLHQYINFINSSMGTNVEQSTLGETCSPYGSSSTSNTTTTAATNSSNSKPNSAAVSKPKVAKSKPASSSVQ
ncbi:lipid storage droplets surface-binding protein 2 isoform X2 [Drosophila persimilis]|uniref:Lipid storage droplets surface-binding protein 2 isoform X2 n=1 Tax=Drosophila pseudoobscura pseudoobscura TaxID=46245 RepID=A0A6I8VH48_DROPS|nr:lipid storage droplets surface-binding protein 2 isoform X2 [Drosophila pseudoobscura]XP_026848388.1 lipid storage droplets surface-binding protein 2 isoform X2 [Drosophila persimilis]